MAKIFLIYNKTYILFIILKSIRLNQKYLIYTTYKFEVITSSIFKHYHCCSLREILFFPSFEVGNFVLSLYCCVQLFLSQLCLRTCSFYNRKGPSAFVISQIWFTYKPNQNCNSRSDQPLLQLSWLNQLSVSQDEKNYYSAQPMHE